MEPMTSRFLSSTLDAVIIAFCRDHTQISFVFIDTEGILQVAVKFALGDRFSSPFL